MVGTIAYRARSRFFFVIRVLGQPGLGIELGDLLLVLDIVRRQSFP